MKNELWKSQWNRTGKEPYNLDLSDKKNPKFFRLWEKIIISEVFTFGIKPNKTYPNSRLKIIEKSNFFVLQYINNWKKFD